MNKYFRHLPLKHAYNVRDLGGYPCRNGNNITNYRKFLRADDLCNLDTADKQFLFDYGLTSVIDLRSTEEIKLYPDPFSFDDRVDYRNIPLITEIISDITRITEIQQADIMTRFYLSLIQQAKNAFKEIFQFMASCEGTLLFHCTAGKDRTGVTAMLLLMLADTFEEDILADYSITFIYNDKNPVMRELLKRYPSEVLRSDAAFLMPVLELIQKEYGTAKKYLEHTGLASVFIDQVIQKICY